MVLPTLPYHSRFEEQYVALNQLTHLALSRQISHLKVELPRELYLPIQNGAKLLLHHFAVPTLLPIALPTGSRSFSYYLGLAPCTLQSKMSVARHLGAVSDLFSLPVCTLEMKQAFEKVAKAGIEEHERKTPHENAG